MTSKNEEGIRAISIDPNLVHRIWEAAELLSCEQNIRSIDDHERENLVALRDELDALGLPIPWALLVRSNEVALDPTKAKIAQAAEAVRHKAEALIAASNLALSKEAQTLVALSIPWTVLGALNKIDLDAERTKAAQTKLTAGDDKS